MLEIVNPKLLKNPLDITNIGGGWSYVLDYSFADQVIGEHCQEHKTNTVLDVGCGKSRFYKHIGDKYNLKVYRTDRKPFPGIDFTGNFEDINFNKTFDIVYWISSIEHNETNKIKSLYLKSMSLLNPGGLFVATYPVAEKTSFYYVGNRMQTDLSMEDAMNIYDETEYVGNLSEIKNLYGTNIFHLRDKYVGRFKKFDKNDPIYVTACTYKVK